MDRYVIKERRSGVEYPQGNQIIAFSASNTIGNNITSSIPVSPNLYYSACGEPPSVQTTASGFASVNVNAQHYTPNNMHLNSGQFVSGIDPRYLAAYSSDSMTSIPGPSVQQILPEDSMFPANVAFGSNYQIHNLYPVEKVVTKPVAQQRFPQVLPVTENQRFEAQTYSNFRNNRSVCEPQSPQQLTSKASATTRKQSEVNLLKNEAQNRVRTRSEKLKALYKSGPRAFSGPVEKVLKWHKSLQDIGLLVFYEIVAKCVSVRPGERCAKNIVVRDDNGPAMQVVYYEVDFFLPDLNPPCTIRVIGRMMPGTCRLQAFNVRIATGDDVSTLPRRAAVAAHHVAKICKEYGRDSETVAMGTS